MLSLEQAEQRQAPPAVAMAQRFHHGYRAAAGAVATAVQPFAAMAAQVAQQRAAVVLVQSRSATPAALVGPAGPDLLL